MSDLLRQLAGAQASGADAQRAVQAAVPSRDLLRLNGLVIARGGSSLELEIRGERWTATAEGRLPAAVARDLRVVLEVPAGGAGRDRPARLLLAAGVRLRTPVELVLRPATPAAGTASDPPPAPALPVTLRRVGAAQPAVPARLMLTGLAMAAPSPAPATGSSLSSASPSAPAGRPAAPPPTASANAAGGGPAVLEAEVVGSDPAGRILLRAGSVMLEVEEPLQLPPGTRVRVVVDRDPAPGGVAGERAGDAPQARPGGAPGGGRERAHLEPDHRLAARLLDLASELVQASRDPAKAAAPSAIASGAQDQAAPMRDAAGGLFRMLALPFGMEGERLGLRLYVRDDPGERRGAGPERGRERSRRAIIEVDFAVLGPCQLDVLCQGRRFELRLRSLREMPGDVRRRVLELFTTARDAGGLEGDLEFAPGALVALEPAAPVGRSLSA